jgi:N6-L-threonylcarbamoyladenine synthase
MGLYLGIDTSNYTTSLALADENGIVENFKMLLPVKEGERGLRQSDAVFSHVKQLPLLFERLGKREITAIGYSATPRSCEGSYMPCFLTGEAIARSIGALLNVPLYRFSHQDGHLCAAAYSADRLDLIESEFLAFHVSGGTTELLHVKKGEVACIGGSADLHAGQAVDRIGTMLSLSFPCGPALEELSQSEAFPPCRVSVRGLNCSLSGLENQAKELKKEGKSDAYIAAYTLSYLAKSIDALSENARKIYPDLPILYAGGVMSNRRIQSYLAKRENVYFAQSAFSSDNAAGIALLCRKAYLA